MTSFTHMRFVSNSNRLFCNGSPLLHSSHFQHQPQHHSSTLIYCSKRSYTTPTPNTLTESIENDQRFFEKNYKEYRECKGDQEKQNDKLFRFGAGHYYQSKAFEVTLYHSLEKLGDEGKGFAEQHREKNKKIIEKFGKLQDATLRTEQIDELFADVMNSLRELHLQNQQQLPKIEKVLGVDGSSNMAQYYEKTKWGASK